MEIWQAALGFHRSTNLHLPDFFSKDLRLRETDCAQIWKVDPILFILQKANTAVFGQKGSNSGNTTVVCVEWGAFGIFQMLRLASSFRLNGATEFAAAGRRFHVDATRAVGSWIVGGRL